MHLSWRFLAGWSAPAVLAAVLAVYVLGLAPDAASAAPAPSGQCTAYPPDAGSTGDTGSTGWAGHADAVAQEQEDVDTCNAMVVAANALHGDEYVIAGAIVAVFVFGWVAYYVMPS